MNVWVDGALVDAARGARCRRSTTGCRRATACSRRCKVVAGRPFAVRRHLERLAPLGGGLGLVARPTTPMLRAALDEVVAANGLADGAAADHRHRRPVAARLGPGRRARRPSSWPAVPLGRPPGRHRRRHRAVAAQRAGRAGRAEDDLLRRERRRPRLRQGAGRDRGDLRQPRRATCARARAPTVRSARRPAGDPAALGRLPGGRHARPHPRAHRRCRRTTCRRRLCARPTRRSSPRTDARGPARRAVDGRVLPVAPGHAHRWRRPTPSPRSSAASIGSLTAQRRCTTSPTVTTRTPSPVSTTRWPSSSTSTAVPVNVSVGSSTRTSRPSVAQGRR